MSVVVNVPVSIGFASRLVVVDCVRKWFAGAVLTEVERQLVDEALIKNRVELLQGIFVDRETDHDC